MSDSRLRRHIAIEAAKLMYERVESEYFTAKRKAAARLGLNYHHHPQELPSNREIRDEIQSLARLYEGEGRLERLADMRLCGLRMMRLLAAFHPRLIGSTITGHVRKGSDIDIHVFSDEVSAIADVLDQYNYRYEVERKRIIKHNEERLFTHVHVHDEFTYELTVYARELVNYVFKSSITGKAIERASIPELEALIAGEHPGVDVGHGEDEEAGALDKFLVWSLLLPPLEAVKQNPTWHPEGDALYHSLQAFELARDEYPYDQELITAALLHDVGKAIDAADHVAAGLEALEATLTEREEFLIEHHMEALAYREGTLGAKARAKLQASEWFEDLLALRDIDNRARVPGADVCTVDEALEFLRGMEEEES
jgi:predicted nucleotidyltransferase